MLEREGGTDTMREEATMAPSQGGEGQMEEAVRARYSAASKTREEALCCPVEYDQTLLEVIPEEVIAKDYGCGDPTRHLRPGDVVLDLGSGSGKACFIASQMVGPGGRVIGVDMNDDMLALARKHQGTVAERIGFDNVEFRKAKLQDLRLDRDRLDRYLDEHPIGSEADYQGLEAHLRLLRDDEPLIPDNSVDVVISNCVLNLVHPEDKSRLFEEIHRVLAEGGRAIISDIVSDEEVPEHLRRDPELWSGCISGSFQEREFLAEFEKAGFWGLTIAARQEEPWQTVEGIEFRSVTLIATKGRTGPCLEGKQAVIYRGPFQAVEDDDGHVLPRGERVAVCKRTFETFSQAPYRDQFILIQPRVEVPEDSTETFPCSDEIIFRHPRETKGADYRVTSEASGQACCSPDQNGCC